MSLNTRRAWFVHLFHCFFGTLCLFFTGCPRFGLVMIRVLQWLLAQKREKYRGHCPFQLCPPALARFFRTIRGPFFPGCQVEQRRPSPVIRSRLTSRDKSTRIDD